MTSVASGWADVLQGDELAYLGSEPAREGRSEPFPDDLDPRVASALVAVGITSLWRHQAEAWAAHHDRWVIPDEAVDAPGFLPVKGTALVRTSPTAPLVFTLTREPGPRPASLPANIQAQIAAANVLRDQGRFDEAITAYEALRSRHSALTSINLVIGAAYRQKASLEVDAAARRALLERAIDAYTHLLTTDPENERAKAELASARAEATPSPN